MNTDKQVALKVYLILKGKWGTLEEETTELMKVFKRSRQTCRKMVKWCEKKGWVKTIYKDFGVIDLWAMSQKVNMPLYNLTSYKMIIMDFDDNSNFKFELPLHGKAFEGDEDIPVMSSKDFLGYDSSYNKNI